MKFLPSVSFLLFSFFSIPAWSQISSKQGASKSIGISPQQLVEPVKPVSSNRGNTPGYNAASTPSSALPNTPNSSLPNTPKNKAVNNGQIRLIWGKPLTYKADESTPAITYLNLKEGVYNRKNHSLPEFCKLVQLNAESNSATASITNPKYEPLTEAEVKALDSNKKWVASDIVPHTKVMSARKAFYISISFIPVRKNELTNTYEKLVSFGLDINQTKRAIRATKHNPVIFANSSVLDSGTWFRIGVTSDGIYKLNAAFFVKAGIDTTKLIPANIRIYGNGGAMLPQANNVYRPDDLIQNAIYVQGQTDTSFKKNDYVLFYGQSPNVWAYSSSDGRFHHTVNVYSDTAFYFLNIDLGPGKRIAKETSLTTTPTNTVSTFDDYAYHELDGVNLIQSGSEWMGEFFETTTQYNFSFPFENISNSGPVYVNTQIASRNCNASSSYTIYSGATGVTTTIGPGTCGFDETYAIDTPTATYTYTPTPGSSIVPVTITKQTPSAVGWLYYIETNVRRQLIFPSNQTQMEFRDIKSVGAGNTSLFTISSTTPIQVWDVTNPQNADSVSFLSHGGGTYSFDLPSDTLKQYIAFTNTGNSFLTPVYFGKVANQNLHGMPQADMIIVSNPLFMTQAKQLAMFHLSHDNLKVNVVTTQEVYNEFSSGVQDPTAIRDFVRMFYDRATNYASMPKYLLLMGGGSYDPKHRIQSNTNYVVAYESEDSFDPAGGTYVSDDYFALLDSSVSTPPEDGSYLLDIAVGRLTVDNVTEAQACVNKVMIYETPTGQSAAASTSCCNTQNQYTLGNWRNTICFIAHDGESNAFESASEEMADSIESKFKNLNVNKIYLDAYPMVQTPGGARYPAVNVAIDNQMNQGLLLYNYEGHGGPVGLAYERVLDASDINLWTNLYAMPLFFNGSCAFGEWDDPAVTSGGQLSVTLPTGGVISMISATRAVFLGGNATLNEAFIDSLYSTLPDGTLSRIGDILTKSKNNEIDGVLGSVNNLCYSLIGDPAVRLNYPKYNIQTTAITTPSHDTLKSLAKVTISGNVEDNSGNIITSFNGLLYPTIYDKPDSITTLANLGPGDPGPTGYGPSYPITFGIQNSELYRGLISVNQGKFTFTFVMPKDILYYYGPSLGKISYYAQNGTSDAAGNESIVVGGTSPTAHNNGIGPKLRLYMNDSNFAFDGLTNQNPSLYAVVFDSNGINTTGTSIGHDITAVLDNNTANTYDITSYYQPSLNSYQKGTITFPFSSLSNGTHNLSLRVWNVYDNTSVTTTEFNVEPQSNLQLQHVLNYPDPFTTHTQFFFEINQVCDQMDVQIQIFSVSGKLVRNILTSVKTDSFRSEPIDWDGKDDYGDRIARGVYIYHLKVRTSNGTTADTYQKLVIL